MINLQNRKKEIMEQIGIDGLSKLKKVKLLKLLKLEIVNLMNYWTLGQILEQINNEFQLSISKTVFYDFCAKNIKKDEKSKTFKKDKIEEDVSQKRDTKKEKAILDDDELSAVAMFINKKD